MSATDEDRTPDLTHLDSRGRPRMVDVTAKNPSRREAEAVGWIRTSPETLRAVEDQRAPKGNVLLVAELAGIQAAKRTAELIPLCHVIPEVSATVELEPDADLPGIRARVVARASGVTGVEMEALTAVSVALLTAYDMLKGLEKGMEIGGIRLVRKEGGRSGVWVFDRDPSSEDPRRV